MEWTEIDQFGAMVLYSGNYKITYYHYCGEHPVSEGTKGATRGYHAYFKPHSWKSWGNNILSGGKFFKSSLDAKIGCERHLGKYGNDPNECDRITLLE